MGDTRLYKSGNIHDSSQASEYSQTHELPHRFLAYRDLSAMLKRAPPIVRALDLGCGTGFSTHYLAQMGLEAIGVDQSPAMVAAAQQNFPEIPFFTTEDTKNLEPFDLVFSSFVLFELSSKQEIISYLNTAANSLKEGGLFLAITGSENLHRKDRDWMCFYVDYDENTNPQSGDTVKLGLFHPNMEFYDYYWKESDYKSCFKASNLKLLRVDYPLGLKEDPYEWRDELSIAPFAIFLARKT